MSPAWPTLLKARASVDTALPMALHSVALKLAAVPMTCGKDVAEGVGAANTTPGEMATPCSASFHLRGGCGEVSKQEREREESRAGGRMHAKAHAPLVRRDEETRHARRGVGQQAELLRHREPPQQVCAA